MFLSVFSESSLSQIQSCPPWVAGYCSSRSGRGEHTVTQGTKQKKMEQTFQSDHIAPLNDCCWSLALRSAEPCVCVLVNTWRTIWHLLHFLIRTYLLKGTLTCMYMRYSTIIDPQLHSLLQASGLSSFKIILWPPCC